MLKLAQSLTSEGTYVQHCYNYYQPSLLRMNLRSRGGMKNIQDDVLRHLLVTRCKSSYNDATVRRHRKKNEKREKIRLYKILIDIYSQRDNGANDKEQYCFIIFLYITFFSHFSFFCVKKNFVA